MSGVVYAVLVIIGFFVIMRILIWVNGRIKKGKTIQPFAGDIGRKIQAGERMLLYFYSPTCGACKSMTPLIDEMKKDKNNIYKINLAQDREIGSVFGIMGTPATIVVENSRIDQFYLGARSKKFLTGLII
jgi:thioredoxin 1